MIKVQEEFQHCEHETGLHAVCAAIQGWENEGAIKVEHFENSGQQSQKLMLKQQHVLLSSHRLQAHLMSIFSSVNTAVHHYQSKAKAEMERLGSDSSIVA